MVIRNREGGSSGWPEIINLMQKQVGLARVLVWVARL